jgi:hypothetical protein
MPQNLPDGYTLENGICVSRKGGYNVAVYRCKCGREQTAACPSYPGGIDSYHAELMGWRKIDGLWECPFCTNNLDNLFKVFGIEGE